VTAAKWTCYTSDKYGNGERETSILTLSLLSSGLAAETAEWRNLKEKSHTRFTQQVV
jgi:hypothetical protein